jgi:hypothetical protein
VPDQANLLYDRDVRTRVFHEGRDALRAVATLKDDTITPFGFGTVHEMRLEVWLDRPSLTITAVDADMEQHPQQACPFTTRRMRELVGLSVGKGYLAELHARFGGNRGCNHLVTMAQSIGTTVALAAFAASAYDDPPAAASPGADWVRQIATAVPQVIGSCAIWHADGELARHARGEAP